MMLDNPYWESVKDSVRGGLVVTGNFMDAYRLAFTRYAWTVSDPESVDFVAKYADDKIVDPFAGTGYWCYLLCQFGIETVCYDAAPDQTMNPDFIEHHQLWVPVEQGRAEDVIAAHPDHTFLLAGPPYDDPAAYNAVRRYGGNRVIFMGDRRSSGDANLYALLAAEWAPLAEHVPVQWAGWNLDDRITIYERNK